MNTGQIKVLIFEDNLTDVLLLQAALERDTLDTFLLTHVETLQSGLIHLKQADFDIVLLDLGLPDSQGLATFEKVHKQTPDIPVVVFSGNLDEQNAIAAVRAEAQDYLVKSLNGFEMAPRAIRHAIERHKLARSLKESEQRFFLAFQASPAPQVIVRIADQVMLDVNEAFCVLVEHQRSQLLGQTTARLGLVSGAEQHSKLIALFQEYKEHRNEELEFRAPSGSVHTILVSLEPMELNAEKCIIATAIDVTERKQAEEALRQSLANQLGLIESTDDQMWSVDTQYRLIIGNTQFLLYTEQVLGRKLSQGETVLSELIPQEARQEWKGYFDRALGSERFTVELVTSLVQPYRYREICFNPIYDVDGLTIGVGLSTRDITERKQAEEVLRQSESELALAQQVAKLGNWRYDMLKKSITWSEEVYRIFEVEKAEFDGTYAFYLTCLHPDDRPKALDSDRIILDEGKSFEIEYRINLRDGQVKYIREIGYPQRDVEGQVVGSFGTVQDITERKRAEEALRASEERYRLISGLTSDYVYSSIVNLQGASLTEWASGAFEHITGYTLEEVNQLANGFASLTLPEDLKHLMQQQVTIFEKGTMDSEYRIRCKDGQIRWLHDYIQLIPGTSGSSQFKIVGAAQDITERKQTQIALQAAENKYRTLVEQSPVVVYVDEVDGPWRYLSPQLKEVLGYEPEEFIQTRGLWRSLIHPEDHARVEANTRASLENGNRITIEYRVNTRSGKQIWLHDEAEMSNDPITGHKILHGVFYDITERKQAEQALRLSEEKYRGLMESLDSVVATVDAEGRFLYMNDVAAQQWGGTAAELVGRTLYDLFPEPVAIAQLQSIQKVLEEDKKNVSENLSVVRGQPRWYRTMLEPIHDETGRATHVLLNATDIHELKTAQLELMEWAESLEERVRQRTAEVQDLYDNAPAGYHSLDGEGRIVMINQTELNWLGYQRVDVIGNPFTMLLTPESQTKFQLEFPKFKDRGAVRDQEIEFVRRDGSTLPVLFNSVAIKDGLGNFVMSRSTVFDNTFRLEAEKALRESQSNLQDFLDTASDLIQSLDAEGRYMYVNAAWCEALGYTAAEAQQLSIFDVADPDYHDRCRKVLQKLIESGHPQPVEILFRTKQAEKLLVEGSVSGHMNKTGQFVTNGIFRNITQRKQTEDALRSANFELERALRMKDEFLASMSHELRTPLTGILGLSEALQYNTYGDLNQKQLSALSNIESSGRHLLELINDILDVSKIEAGKLELTLEPCSLDEISQASIQLVKGMAHKKRQNLAFSMNPAAITIQADGRRLKQIMVNLLSNAVKYSPEQSDIGLEIKADEASQTVRIEVWDHGIGIAQADLKKLFQPFVQLDSSLSRQQSGTGLGLALVQRLIDLHGGSIQVESSPDQGSRFIVLLPYLPSEAIYEPDQGEVSPKLKHTMIVEDSTLDADRLTRYLRTLGVNSTVHTQGSGVIEKAAKLKPGVIMLDLHLPDISGWEVLEELKRNELTRDIPVVITSVEEDRERATQLGAAGYLVKLFTLDDLRWTLKRTHPTDGAHAASALVVSPQVHLGTIMVVDDNEVNVFMLEDFLRSNNYSVFTAHSGVDFLIQAPEVRPDLVLMDIQMPDMDGLETIRRLRLLPDPRLASVPVIAITALAMPGDREQCLEAGANEYLSKPVRLKELAATIQRMISPDEATNG